MPEVSIQYVGLSELQRWPRNPKDHDLGQIHRSIERFGYVNPVLLDERTEKLVAGHGRLDALQQMKASGKEPPKRIQTRDGEWYVPVVRGIGFNSDAEAEAYLLADNRLTELGGWQEEDLADVLADLAAEGEMALEGVGWDESDVDQLLADLGRNGGPVEEDEYDDTLSEDPSSQRGEVYELGPHRLMCGDATDEDDVAALLGGAVPDLTITDPPYSVAYERSREERGGDADAHEAYEDPATAAEILRFVRDLPSDRLVMTYPVDRHFFTLADELERGGFELRKELVWVKDRFSFWPGAKFQQQHEPVLLCARKGVPLGADVPANESTVQEYARPRAHDEHATQKPMGLWVKLLRAHTSRGDLVYDPFVGSGTTIIAAEDLGRTCYAMEIAPAYCDVIRQRYAAFTDQPDLAP